MAMKCEEAVLVRIFFGEDNKYEGKPLYKHLVEFCKSKGIAGATVFRGILGYGKSSVLHKASLFKLSSDLPIVVEIIDCQEKIDQVLPEIAQMVKDGLITMEKVKVIRA
jgi:PII-like signaling protein